MPDVVIYFLLSLPLVGVYSMFAIGIVVIYRASRVLNLAHGGMAMLPAYITYSLTEAGLPMWAGLLAGVAGGSLLGLAVERGFVRRLRGVSATTQTVGTVAALGLMVAGAAFIWGTAPRPAPPVFPAKNFQIGDSILRYGDLGLFGVSLLAAGAFFVMFQKTDFGLAMRAAAQNRRAVSLMGVDPNRPTMMAWVLGGGLAAVAGILLAAVTNLHPFSLSLATLPAFVAALIGGLESLPGALAGAAVVGIAQAMVPALGGVPGLDAFVGQVGAPHLVLTVIAFAVMASRGQGLIGSDTREEM